MRILLGDNQALTIKLRDNREVTFTYQQLSLVAELPGDTVPEDGFMISYHERDGLRMSPPKKISAIRGLRQRTGWSLKRAKMHVEAYQALHGLPFVQNYRH